MLRCDACMSYIQCDWKLDFDVQKLHLRFHFTASVNLGYIATSSLLVNINVYSTTSKVIKGQNIPIFSSMPLTNHSNLRLGSPTGTTRHSKWACCPSHSSDGPVSNWVKIGFSNARSGSSGRAGARPSSSCFIFFMPSGCWVSNWILALAT